MEFKESNFELEHPTTCMVAGPTGCGKTRFVGKILQARCMIRPMPNRIVWVYGEWQPLYDELLGEFNIEFRKNNIDSDLYESFSPQETNLLILDDQMTNSSNAQKKNMVQLFTQGSHHRNLTIIYIVQNLFDNSSTNRTISLNAQYMVIFKNPRDTAQIRYLAMQIYPNNRKFLIESYSDATRSSHSYLFLNLTQNCEDWRRVSTQIFPGEESELYIPTECHIPDGLVYNGIP